MAFAPALIWKLDSELSPNFPNPGCSLREPREGENRIGDELAVIRLQCLAHIMWTKEPEMQARGTTRKRRRLRAALDSPHRRLLPTAVEDCFAGKVHAQDAVEGAVGCGQPVGFLCCRGLVAGDVERK